MKQFFIITFFSMLISFTTAVSQTIPKEGCVECIENDAFINGRTTTRQFTLFDKGEIRPGFVLTALNENGDAYWDELAPSVGGSLWQINLNKDLYTLSKVGIGIDSPQFDLHVKGTTFIEDLRLYPTHSSKIEPGFVLTATDNLGNAQWMAPGTSTSQQCISCDGNTVDFSEYASAVGKENTASGHASFAMGKNSMAIGIASGAFGYDTEAHATAGFAIGRKIKSVASGAIILGTGYGYTDFLINGDANTLAIGFNSTAPTFFVSKSETYSSFKDRTGRIGIGNVREPEAKLHIRADDDESATLYLETSNWSTNYNAKMWFGNKLHGISAIFGQGLTFNTENNFVFEDGNVGIGTDEPMSLLEVHGQFRPQFSLSNNLGNIIVALAENAGDFAPAAQPGDAVFKTHNNSDHHGIIFNINDNFNDGMGYIKFNDNHNHNTLTILNNGRVGIGISRPNYKLDVAGDINFSGDLLFNGEPFGASTWEQVGDNISFITGNVGIGTINTYGYRLAVNGKILTDEVMIKDPVDWFDYVLKPEYNLMPLNELEIFINQNSHLPDVPSEAEVTKNGYGLAEMNGILLKKVEELTLYIIEQQKSLEAQQTEMKNMKEFIGLKNN